MQTLLEHVPELQQSELKTQLWPILLQAIVHYPAEQKFVQQSALIEHPKSF